MDLNTSVVTNIIPKHDFVVVKPDPEVDITTPGGIFIPAATLQNKKTLTGTVVAVGPGRYDPAKSSELLPMQCKPGDRILCALFIGYPVSIREGDILQDYLIIKDYDVMAVVNVATTKQG